MEIAITAPGRISTCASKRGALPRDAGCLENQDSEPKTWLGLPGWDEHTIVRLSISMSGRRVNYRCRILYVRRTRNCRVSSFLPFLCLSVSPTATTRYFEIFGRITFCVRLSHSLVISVKSCRVSEVRIVMSACSLSISDKWKIVRCSANEYEVTYLRWYHNRLDY